MPVYEARECVTLGTFFKDIYKDGILFASEVSDTAARWIIKNPQMFGGNVSAPIEKFRCWEIEKEYLLFGKMK